MAENDEKQYAVGAIKIARSNQVEQYKVQTELQKANEVLFETIDEQSGKGLLSRISDLLYKQIENTEEINGKFQNLSTIEIKSNKNIDILNLVRGLINSGDGDEIVMQLAAGKCPKGYENTISYGELPKLNADNSQKLEDLSFWGSSKSLIYTVSLAITNYAMQQVINASEILKLPAIYGKLPNVNSKASFFEYSIVNPVSFSQLKDLAEKSIFHTVESDSIKFGTPHAGYAWGGVRYSEERIKPFDCSSFFEMVYGLNQINPKPTATTADLYFTYLTDIYQKWQLPLPGNIANWQGSASGVLSNHIKAVESWHDVVPGDIYLIRKFAQKDDLLTGFGSKGGHTGIILEKNPNKTFTIIEVNRLMPVMEGFGIREVTAKTGKAIPGVDGVWQQVNTLRCNHESEFANHDLYYNDFRDLTSIVQHFDKEQGVSAAGDIVEIEE